MIEYDNFSRSLENLAEVAKLQAPYTVVEQAGIAALFEICFEQSWKLMKLLLEQHGHAPRKIGSATSVIKLAYQAQMIASEEGWLSLLKTRNMLIHTYNSEKSPVAIESIRHAYLGLFQDLRKEIEARWMPWAEESEKES